MKAKFDLSFVVDSCNGKLISEVQNQFIGVGTDTRAPLDNLLFTALKGDNFDAHNFLGKAVEKGAAGLLVSKLPENIDELKAKVSIVLVKDTLKALQELATAWRKKVSVKVIGITGSNGKTTTKEFAATLLASKFNTFASPASFNNHWGVPISLLSIKEEDQLAVIEMGMNHRGEITELCNIALPDIVLVTMVGSAHIGEVGSQEDIAKAKDEIYSASPNAIKIFNSDNEYTIAMWQKYKLLPGKSFRFSSFDKDADVSLRVEQMKFGSIILSGQISGIENKLEVPVFGRHNINNIMASCCICLACGMTPNEIWEALPSCRGIWGRNQVYELNSGAKVLFDAYNANLESTSALVKNLFEFDLSGKKVAVIGQMLELGQKSPGIHEELGELVANTGFDTVWFIGSDKGSFQRGLERGGFDKNLFLSDTYEESLAIQLGSMLNQQDVAIIKGSRGMKLEQVLEAWQTNKF